MKLLGLSLTVIGFLLVVVGWRNRQGHLVAAIT